MGPRRKIPAAHSAANPRGCCTMVWVAVIPHTHTHTSPSPPVTSPDPGIYCRPLSPTPALSCLGKQGAGREEDPSSPDVPGLRASILPVTGREVK